MVYLKTPSCSSAKVIEIWMCRPNEEKGPAAAIKEEPSAERAAERERSFRGIRDSERKIIQREREG